MRRGHSCDPAAELLGHIVHAVAMIYMTLAMCGVMPMNYFTIAMSIFTICTLFFVWRAVQCLFDDSVRGAIRDAARATSCVAMAYMFVDVRVWPIWCTLAAVAWSGYVFAQAVGTTHTLLTVTHVERNMGLVLEYASHALISASMFSMLIAMQSAQETARINGILCGLP